MKERIRRLIEINKCSEREFALQAGINPSTLNLALDVERGEPSIDVVLKILNTYNISANWLLLGLGEIIDGERRLSEVHMVTAHAKKNRYIEDWIAEIDERLKRIEQATSSEESELGSEAWIRNPGTKRPMRLDKREEKDEKKSTSPKKGIDD